MPTPYYETFQWGETGLGSVDSGGDGSLYFTAFSALDATVINPSFDYIVENPISSGCYVLRVPDWVPQPGDYGVISKLGGGVGNVITFSPSQNSDANTVNVSIGFEETRIQ